MPKQTRFLDLLEPVMSLIPEVKQPDRRTPFRERFMWTCVVLFIFLVASQIPLYGVNIGNSSDPFYYVRLVMASNRGTLMELGISPIITSSMIMQFLHGAKIIDVDMSLQSDCALFQGAQKLFGLLITFGTACAYVLGGMYGNLADLGLGVALLIIAQLLMSGLCTLLLDELLTKGYGLGSGISLFIATNICETIIWKSFSPTTVNTGRGAEFEGCIIAFFHLMISRDNKWKAFKEAMYRQNLPNLSNLLATIVVFAAVIYFQGFKVEVPLTNTRVRGGVLNKFPIKLFYTSNIPIILQTSLITNLYFLSQLLYKRYPTNLLVRLFGSWKSIEGISTPVGGLAYYLSPPKSAMEIIYNPLHVLVYLVFILGSCAMFARFWIDISGNNARQVARNLRAQGFTIAGGMGTERSMIKQLNKHIPIAAAFGGMCLALLSVSADFLGAIGSGTGILLAVTIIYQYVEILAREGASMGNFLGI